MSNTVKPQQFQKNQQNQNNQRKNALSAPKLTEDNITTLEQLTEYKANGSIVELPPFDDSVRFIVRLRRPSLMSMIAQGHIPNALLPTAIDLFEGNTDKNKQSTIDDIKGIYDMLIVFARACLVQPTYQELEEAGIQLTDEQMFAIYNYAQKGARALDSFRAQQTLVQAIESLQEISAKTQSAAGNK